LADGAAENYEEYRHRCGVIRGIYAVLERIEELEQREEDADG